MKPKSVKVGKHRRRLKPISEEKLQKMAEDYWKERDDYAFYPDGRLTEGFTKYLADEGYREE